MQRIEKWLNGHGRNIIGWDEILQGGISKTATVMSWRGSKGGIAAAKAGNTVIMAPNTHCYLDYRQTQQQEFEPLGQVKYLPMRQVYALDPYEQLTPDERKYILGVQGNLWTEYIPDFRQVKHMLLPRLARSPRRAGPTTARISRISADACGSSARSTIVRATTTRPISSTERTNNSVSPADGMHGGVRPVCGSLAAGRSGRLPNIELP